MKKTAKKIIYSIERYWLSRSNRELSRPDFIGIGSGQAGSTWMFKNFQAHPDVFVCDKKETHYFSYAFNDWSFSYYCSLFDPGRHQIKGESTPAYLLLTRERIAQVHNLLPKTKLIMTIRNPIERAWSGARRTLTKIADQQNTTLDKLPDTEFYSYFDNEWAYRPERNPIGEFVPHMLQGHYSRSIDNWLTSYPQSQLKIIFFDDIKNRPRDLMAEVCQFIGARTDIDWTHMPLSKVVNKNPSKAMPTKFHRYLCDLYAEEIEELQHRFKSKTQSWLTVC